MAPPAVNGTTVPATSPTMLDQTSPATSPKPAPFSLGGKTIVITGGGRGLGLTLAHAVIEAGGQVACLDILPEPSSAEWSRLVKLSKASHHPDPFPIYRRCDIANETQLSSTLKEIAQHAEDSGATFSGIVACAGIQQQVPALDYEAQDFENILRVNVTGTFLTAKWAARVFIEQKTAGSIVLIASMSGQIANRVSKIAWIVDHGEMSESDCLQGLTCTAYNSSKSAVHQMCRSVAQEWGRSNIRVNTLSPGVSRSPCMSGISFH